MSVFRYLEEIGMFGGYSLSEIMVHKITGSRVFVNSAPYLGAVCWCSR